MKELTSCQQLVSKSILYICYAYSALWLNTLYSITVVHHVIIYLLKCVAWVLLQVVTKGPTPNPHIHTLTISQQNQHTCSTTPACFCETLTFSDHSHNNIRESRSLACHRRGAFTRSCHRRHPQAHIHDLTAESAHLLYYSCMFWWLVTTHAMIFMSHISLHVTTGCHRRITFTCSHQLRTQPKPTSTIS